MNNSLVPDLKGRDVVILDDIFDTGHTMVGMNEAVKGFEPASVKSAVLLWKTARSQVNVSPDYYGFKIPNEFVVARFMGLLMNLATRLLRTERKYMTCTPRCFI